MAAVYDIDHEVREYDPIFSPNTKYFAESSFDYPSAIEEESQAPARLTGFYGTLANLMKGFIGSGLMFVRLVYVHGFKCVM